MLITTIFQRPSTDVEWWTTVMPEEIRNHYKQTYDDTGKRIGEEYVYSEDGLTMTFLSRWVDDPMVAAEFSDDPIVKYWKDLRKYYCDSVGIVLVSQIMSYYDSDLNEEITIDVTPS